MATYYSEQQIEKARSIDLYVYPKTEDELNQPNRAATYHRSPG